MTYEDELQRSFPTRAKQMLNKVIDRIVIKNEKIATVHFKSGLVMEKTLS